MGSGTGEGPVRGSAAGAGAPSGGTTTTTNDNRTGSRADAVFRDDDDDGRPEPLADLLAQIAGIVSTRIVRGAYMQSMATLVAAGRSVDEAAAIAGELFERAERTVPDATVRLRPREDPR